MSYSPCRELRSDQGIEVPFPSTLFAPPGLNAEIIRRRARRFICRGLGGSRATPVGARTGRGICKRGSEVRGACDALPRCGQLQVLSVSLHSRMMSCVRDALLFERIRKVHAGERSALVCAGRGRLRTRHGATVHAADSEHVACRDVSGICHPPPTFAIPGRFQSAAVLQDVTDVTAAEGRSWRDRAIPMRGRGSDGRLLIVNCNRLQPGMLTTGAFFLLRQVCFLQPPLATCARSYLSLKVIDCAYRRSESTRRIDAWLPVISAREAAQNRYGSTHTKVMLTSVVGSGRTWYSHIAHEEISGRHIGCTAFGASTNPLHSDRVREKPV